MAGTRRFHDSLSDLRLDDQERRAVRIDLAALRVLRSRGVIDIALGEALDRLFEGDRLLQLGYSKQVDYSRERLGIPPRTMFGWVQLARELKERPLLRKAVMAGEVTARKALTVLPVALGKAEGIWTAAAMTSPLKVLEAAVRMEGKEPPTGEHTFEVDVLWLRMSPEQQDRLDAALAVARKTLSLAAPRWQCEEAICQEWLGDHGEWCPSDDEKPESAPTRERRTRRAW
ncbi:MAG: HNH endonuclease, partial [Planctomycetota bacterium]